MANVKANVAIDFLREGQPGDGGSPPTLNIANETTIQISDGIAEYTYRGEFFYDRNFNVYGDLYTYTVSIDDIKPLVVTEIDRDISRAFYLLDNEGGQAFLGYIFSEGDTIRGSIGSDRLLGYGGWDLIQAGRGDDWIYGNGGGDRLYGDDGDDRLSGGLSNDRLEGGTGGDLLYGGDGLDSLRGGTGKDGYIGQDGADAFVFAAAREAGNRSARDVIFDFSGAEDDLIDLGSIDANALATGDQRFRWIDDDSFSGRAGELRYKGGLVSGDLDGDGVANFQIELANRAALDSADFIL